MERILVTGGTGRLGSAVVTGLRAAGEQVRVLSRRRSPEYATGDLRTGRGVDTALSGVDVIVHCATDFRRETDLARRLVEAARWSGAEHLVYVSIVGVDRIPLGYYQQKYEAERLIADSGLPYTILRATQFHSLVRTLFAAGSRLPVLPVPKIRFQPVDVRDVASRLATLAAGEPVGRADDFGGPEVLDAGDLAHAVTGRRILPVRLPGAVFRGLAEGGNLTPEHADGKITFAEYLAQR